MKPSALFVVVILLVILPITSVGGSAHDVDPFAWLIGDWVREMERGLATESWVRVSEYTMEGTGSVTIGDESRVSEYLRLETFGDQVFYTAKPHQNPSPTPFELIESDGSRFVFENLEHDFPQRIIYAREKENGLLVRIEGEVDGDLQGMEFRFERVNESARVIGDQRMEKPECVGN